ncbi:MAG: Fic family protein [Thermoanaerobaculia bacterium]
MDRRDFTPDAPGRLIGIGGEYVAFVPAELPIQVLFTPRIVATLSAADRALGEVAGVGGRLANPLLLIRPFAQKEAVLSSRIEGTRASLSDLFLFDAAPDEVSVGSDVREVRNYVDALRHGLKRIEELPIGTRLLRELHGVLLNSVRGDGSAGELRRTQVWIGPTTRMADATFIPPPANEIDALLSNLEKYIHQESDVPPLIRLALVHYQFEAIHPFHDGNGRLGRLLIALLLTSEKLLPQPLLYLSAYFERHRARYYELLRAVSTHGAWEDWIVFFLDAVRAQSSDAVARATKLLALRDRYHARFQSARSSALLHKLVDHLFEFPAITIPFAGRLLSVTYRSAQQNVAKLQDVGIVEEVTGQRRNRIFYAREIFNAIDADTE